MRLAPSQVGLKLLDRCWRSTPYFLSVKPGTEGINSRMIF